MRIQDILGGGQKLEEFLIEKGYKVETEYIDKEYPSALFIKLDKRRLLAIIELSNEESIKEIKNYFLIDKGLTHCCLILPQKLLFFRNFGERRYFLYSQRTSDSISKIDKLDKINDDFDLLFQTRDVSGDFYEKFRLKRDFLVRHIQNDFESPEKYLIAQKIFDRIFFIYFLCHKGIIKFSDGRAIGGKSLFKILLENGEFTKNLKNLFHLFNDVEGKSIKIGDNVILVPYLNGGLFRPDVLELDLDISLTNKDWNSILDFLNDYHWIIEDDITVAVHDEEKVLTPEILGHVYERGVVEWENIGYNNAADESTGKKSISERKKKGVYYTPEEITDYISRNTIFPYILEKFGGKYSSIEDILDIGDKSDLEELKNISLNLKILDPACGSGAFLINAAEILFYLNARINSKLGIKQRYYDIKLDIVTENIYGVDILQGSSEISKLRLWLWLIADYVDVVDIKALPNIEYNIRVGNSLVGWIDEKLAQIPLRSPLTDEIVGIFKGLRVYSNNQDTQKIEKARALLGDNEWTSNNPTHPLERYIEAYSLLYSIYRKSHGIKAENLKGIIETIRKAIYSSISPGYYEYVNDRLKKDHIRPIPYTEFYQLKPFHWRVDFGDIIKRGGFDIVIGNPPYVDAQTQSSKYEKTTIKALYLSYTNNCDYYVPFIELGAIKLCSKDGRFSYICPNNFLKLEYGKNIRKLLEGRVYEIDDFGANQVFYGSDITNYSLLIFSRGKCKILDYRYFKYKKDFEPILKSGRLNFSYPADEFEDNISYHSLYQDYKGFVLFNESPWIFLTKLEEKYLPNIITDNIPLTEVIGAKIHEGSSTGDDDFYLLEDCKNKKGLIEGFSKLKEERITIEKELCKKYVKRISEDFRIVDENMFLVFPYKKQGDGYISLSEKELKKYSIGYPYFKEFRGRLEKREDIKKKSNFEDTWFLFSAARSLEYYDKNKIIMKFTSKDKPKFAIDKEGYFHNASINNITIEASIDIPVEVLFNILVSDFTKYFIARFGTFLRGGYIRYEERFLKNLPIPKKIKTKRCTDMKTSYGYDSLFDKFIEKFLEEWISDNGNSELQ
ncbi:Uncharacterised protein [uncultured archaeon]|nr:Uncharacterised protein [uncultured archaeon]